LKVQKLGFGASSNIKFASDLDHCQTKDGSLVQISSLNLVTKLFYPGMNLYKSLGNLLTRAMYKTKNWEKNESPMNDSLFNKIIFFLSNRLKTLWRPKCSDSTILKHNCEFKQYLYVSWKDFKIKLSRWIFIAKTNILLVFLLILHHILKKMLVLNH
jgi:hypothetical protein